MLRWLRKSADKADQALNTFVHHLAAAERAAFAAADHALKAQAVHEAALLFHHERHAAAGDLLAEAEAAAKDVGKLLGNDTLDATVEHVAEHAVETAVVDTVKGA